MKLKKIISLALVFAMIVSVFGALTVSAAEDATLSYVVYDAAGATQVTGNLVEGETYQLAIVLDDIADKNFASAQVVTYYNPAVLQAVRANGDAATVAAQALIETAPDLYDEEEGTGVYSKIGAGCTLDAEKGLISYSLGVNTNVIEEYPEGKANDGTFELCRIRVKAIANGATGVNVASEALGEGKYIEAYSEGVYFYAKKDKCTVSFVNPAIRVGEAAYVSAEVDEAFAASETYVVGTKDAAAVIADLADKYASVNVTYTDEDGENDTYECEITWKAPDDFDGSEAGTYTFTGTVADPEGINYTGVVTVEATITIDTLKVTEVSAIDDLVVRVGDEVTLPSKVEVTVTGGEKDMLAVTWAPETVNTAEAGTTAFVGTIAGTANIEVSDEMKAALNVVVLAESTETEPSDVDPIGAEAPIDAADIAADALAALPEFVVIGTDTKEYINVTDWVQTEDSKKDEYAIGDVLKFQPVAEGVTFPADYVATVTVIVPEGKATVEFDAVSFATEEIKSDKNYTIEDAIEDAAFTGEYADGTPVDLSEIVWEDDTTPAYDSTKAGKYTLTGTWSDIYGHTQTFTIEINIVAAGATGIKLYSSAAGKNAITSITLNTLSAKTIYAVLEPAGVEDTITWTIDKTSYATVSASGANSATIKTKSVAGVAYLTATTSTGASAELKITINAAGNNNGGYSNGSIYQSNGGTGSNLLANAANQEAQNQIAASSAFIDLGGYEWAATQIETLRLLGVVTGKTNSTFAPADSVTRAEFLAMLVRLLNLQAVGTPKTFTDVPADAWYYETVNIASSLGVAHGYENGAFDPNAVISRQDMAVFAERARSVAGINPIIGIGRSFKDQHEISDYAKSAVDYMTSISVINGFEDETFRPLETANRAQAAVVIYNLYALKNQ